MTSLSIPAGVLYIVSLFDSVLMLSHGCSSFFIQKYLINHIYLVNASFFIKNITERMLNASSGVVIKFPSMG